MQLTAMVSNLTMDIRMLQIQVGVMMSVLTDEFKWDEEKQKEVKAKMEEGFAEFMEQVKEKMDAPPEDDTIKTLAPQDVDPNSTGNVIQFNPNPNGTGDVNGAK